MALSASFANHLAPGLMDIVGLRFKNYPAWYSQLMNVLTSERQYEDFLNATGLPIAVARNEGEPVPFYDPLEGSTKRFTHGNFSIGFQVSREAWNDDMYKSKSALRKAAGGLVRSMTEKVEIDAANANFNNGFSTSLAIDGVALYSASHTRLDGGTNQSNLQTSAAISLTTLRQAQLLFYSWNDDRGIKIICNPITLVTSNYDTTAYTAAVLLQSPMQPESSALAKNVTQGFLNQVKYPYLSGTNSNAYFILGDEHQLNFIWRERPTLDSWDDKNTRTAKFASYMRYSAGPVHWVGAVGCDGG